MIYDAAVIGAGPAGATFARIAAKNGMKLLLIDGSGEYGKPCGGLLAPDAQKMLACFDISLPHDILTSPQIFSVKTIDLGTRSVRYYRRMYLNMDRKRFDNFLVSIIPRSVDILKGRCSAVSRTRRGFVVTVRQNGKDMHFRCRNIIGADGASSFVRHRFFPDRKIMKYTAIQQWFRSDSRTDPFYSCIFDPETSESCSWTINKDEFFIYGGCFRPEHCRIMFEKQKKRFSEFSGIEMNDPVRTEACLVCRPEKYSDFVTGRRGVYLIGEAAGFISPSSFEGISGAMMSAKALAEAFEKNSGRTVATAYSKAVLPLKTKYMVKTAKRLFMYVPVLRHAVMASGITAIKTEKK